jgi:broad specificity phosphatase PhoE
MLAMKVDSWGAVVVDDASEPLTTEYLKLFTDRYPGRFTLMQPRQRRGQLANMTAAIRRVCVDPESVIITLDIDDALIGSDVIGRVRAEYDDGADATVGAMLRTDKHKHYEVNLDDPRGHRGGNVWQHLRTFKKKLFDAIPDNELRIGGKYVDIAVDWAFMLPIVESASSPRWIREPLYLYETSGLGKTDTRPARDAQIAEISRRPRIPKLASRQMEPIDVSRIVSGDVRISDGILFIRHAERPGFAGLTKAEQDELPISDAGAAIASSLGKALSSVAAVVTSPISRCIQTGLCVAQNRKVPIEQDVGLKALFVGNDDRCMEAYSEIKERMGWHGMMSDWIDGSLASGVFRPVEEVTSLALQAGLSRRTTMPGPVVAVTHDFVIIALLAALRGGRQLAIPYLGGVLVPWHEAEQFATEAVTR